MSGTVYKQYLSDKTDFRMKWKSYINSDKSKLGPNDFKDELTPFSGQEIYSSFSDEKKLKLFYEYTKFIAESIIVLEQVLMFAFWHYKKNHDFSEPINDSIDKFCNEELYHSEGYRSFLKSQDVFSWPEEKLFLKNKWVVLCITWVIKHAPLGITLPGAKLEAFSVSYYRYLKKIYGDEENSWVELNRLHHEDEIFHIPLEFDIYNSTLDRAGHVKSIVSTFVFFIFLQVTLISSCTQYIKRCFPEKNSIQKFFLIIKMAKWAVREMPAYKDGIKLTQSFFKKKNPKYKSIFKFLRM